DCDRGDTYATSCIPTDSHCLTIRGATGRPSLRSRRSPSRRCRFRPTYFAMTARQEFVGAKAILQGDLIERGYLEELLRRCVETLLDESLDTLVDACAQIDSYYWHVHTIIRFRLTSIRFGNYSVW